MTPFSPPPFSPPASRSDSALVTSYGYLADNIQTLSVTGNPTGGSFTLAFGGHTTGGVAYNATAATVQTDLAALASIGSGNISVVGNPGGPYTIRFIDSLGGEYQSPITTTSSLTGGTSPAASDVVTVPGGDAGMQQSVTDPRDIITKTDFDMLGNTLDSIAAFTDGVPTSDTDQITAYTYDGNDDVLTMTALRPGANAISAATESSGTVTITTSAAHGYSVGQTVVIDGVGVSGYNGTYTITAITSTTFTYTDANTGLGSSSGGTANVNLNQTTAYIYGVGTSGGLYSNDLIAGVQYPDPITGYASSSASNDVSYAYDNLGETTIEIDQNGSTHTYSYDSLGRMTLDAVTTLGSGVDGSIRALGYAYTALSLPYQQTSYSNSAGTTVVNQVQDAYNGFQQLVTEYQEQSGAVNTSTSLKVQYAYSTIATGSLLDEMIYPNGRILHYGYNTGLDSAIGRVSYLADDNGSGGVGSHLVDYTYQGLGTILGQADGNGVTLTTSLNALGQIAEMNYVKSGTSTDDFQYGYDRDGNVLYMKNVVNTSFSELYHANSATSGDDNTAYDPLGRLTGFSRGTLSASANNSGVLDTVTTLNSTSGLTGNSQSWSLDAIGNQTSVTTDGTATGRTQNGQNETTGVGGNALTYDSNGNMTTDENSNTLTYDAWNHLKTDSAGTTSYVYDADGRLISETQSSVTTTFYLTTQDQVIEERQSTTVTAQNVFGIDYVNSLLLRDDNSTSGNLGISGSGLGNRLYYQHDAVFNVTATTNTSGVVQQRFAYTPYGVQTAMNSSWAVSGSNSIYGFQGGRYDAATGLNHFSSREYSPGLGVWLQHDPQGLAEGSDLYEAFASSPTGTTDADGRAPATTQAASQPSLPGFTKGNPLMGAIGSGLYYSNPIRWTAPGFSGELIQHVKSTATVKNCDGSVNKDIADVFTYEGYESWYVSNGKFSIGTTDGDLTNEDLAAMGSLEKANDDNWESRPTPPGSLFHLRGNFLKGTCGSITVTATAKLINAPNGHIITKHELEASHNLPSQIAAPTEWGGDAGGLSRSFTFKWCLCPEKPKFYEGMSHNPDWCLRQDEVNDGPYDPTTRPTTGPTTRQ